MMEIPINELDPARVASGISFGYEWLGFFATSTGATVINVFLILVCASLLAFIAVKHGEEMTWRQMYDKLPRFSLWNKVMSFWERRTMRKKLRKLQEDGLNENIVKYIEDCVELSDIQDAKEKHKRMRRQGQVPMTRTDANLIYQRLAKAYPEFRHAVVKFEDPKARIQESLKNKDRDDKGNIIPVNLPNEPKKEALTQKRKPATFKLRSVTT